MENLLAANPDINLVYTINEPAAAGAYEAIQAAGLDHEVLIVSVDGGCPGVQNVKDGDHRRHLDAVPAAHGGAGRRGRRRPACSRCPTEGLEFTNTGVVLITDEPAEGVESAGHDVGPGELLGLAARSSCERPNGVAVRPPRSTVSDQALQERTCRAAE